MLTLMQGEKLIKLARSSIESFFEKKTLNFDSEKKEFSQLQGCFVTLHKNNNLRGCIGYPYPVKKLAEAVADASKSSAFSDPRFEPLKKDELNKITIEISVLTKPEMIKEKKHIQSEINIGKDGLIIIFGGSSGLLLPQVAVEYKWDSIQFLEQTCIKAGLHPDIWINPNCRIYKFQAQIFSEEKPNGKVVEK